MISSMKLMATSLYLLVFLIGVSRCAVMAPRHTATRENIPVQFQCIPDDSDEYIQWWEFASSAEGAIIFNPLKPEDTDKNKYLFSNSGRNFTIKLPTMSSAGRYECRTLATPGNYPAELIVLKSSVCRNEGGSIAIEGQPAKLTCSVEYTGNKVVTTKWYNEEGRELQDQYNGDTPGNAMKATNFTLRDIDDDSHPSCIVTVAETEYTDNCTIIPSLRVRYTVRDIRIEHGFSSPGKPQFKYGDILNCTARGNPEPQFKWEKLKGKGDNLTVDGMQLEINKNMNGDYTFRCTAENQVNNTHYNATQDIDFVVTSYNGSASHTSVGTFGVLLILSWVAILVLFT